MGTCISRNLNSRRSINYIAPEEEFVKRQNEIEVKSITTGTVKETPKTTRSRRSRRPQPEDDDDIAATPLQSMPARPTQIQKDKECISKTKKSSKKKKRRRPVVTTAINTSKKNKKKTSQTAENLSAKTNNKKAKKNSNNEHRHWLKKVKKRGWDLKYAPEHLKNDKTIVMAAVKQEGLALEYASPTLTNDKEVVLAAVTNFCWALQHASPTLMNDKDVVIAAVKNHPDLIKYAGDDIKRDPDVLIAAGMYDEDHDDAITRQQEANKKRKIVLSTRFSLNPDSESQATNFTKKLKDDEHIKKNFILYAPNAFDKKTCDPKWTDFNHPCRGTNDTCQYTNNVLTETGHPTDDCCWRYSFRSQLEEAKDAGGFMLQLVETGKGYRQGKVDDATLGNGQTIERDMAHSLQLKIFHVYRPTYKKYGYEYENRFYGYEYENWFSKRHVDEVVTAIKNWYDTGCEDMSERIIRPIDHYDDSDESDYYDDSNESSSDSE